MVIDSSALVAIVHGEPDAHAYIEAIAIAIEQRSRIYIPASVLVEAGIVAERRGRGSLLDGVIERIQPEIVPLDRPIAELSRQAFRRFGRGRHRAQLNFGDCMSYATAQYLRLPLLYKGDEFRETDVRAISLNIR